ncbi:MAG: hypothetical protein WD250_17025 [Egibacteraceae bacterium]
MRPPTRLLLTLTVVALLIGVITPTQLGGWLHAGWVWTWQAAAGVAAGWGA